MFNIVVSPYLPGGQSRPPCTYSPDRLPRVHLAHCEDNYEIVQPKYSRYVMCLLKYATFKLVVAASEYRAA